MGVPAVSADLVAPDPFAVVAAGRAAFRAGDLAQLVSACLAAVHGITS